MKTKISLLVISSLAFAFTTGCTGSGKENIINVISREDGSGTRGAFVEIVDVMEEDEEGNKNDNTYEEAVVQNGTDSVMTTVAGDEHSIGYISIGSLNDKVKAVNIEGVEAKAENLQNESYKISRNFNIAYKEDLSSLGEDFMSFILSIEGQAIVAKEGFVEISKDFTNYDKSIQEGKITIAGSTSVSPVMEKLAEEYESLNPEVSIEIQSTGSSAGIQSLVEDGADIGMVSRELKDTEKEFVDHIAIAIDGIAVIVNNENQIENLTLDDVKKIFIGEATTWNDVEK